MTSQRLLVLQRYGRLGPSSRLRMSQYLPEIAASGFDITVQELFDDAMLQSRLNRNRYDRISVVRSFVRRVNALNSRKDFDLLWIEKEALPWWPAELELLMLSGVPYVLDYDDAVFHNYDRHPNPLVRQLFADRVDRIMANASLVIAGNEYLADRAMKAGAAQVEILPTVVDHKRYEPRQHNKIQLDTEVKTIIWIGSPTTVSYLEMLKPTFTQLAAKTRFKLRVVGAEFEMPGIEVECVPWSEDTEASAILDCDVGIMPLPDSPWERGKCGYKLVQYMACGLPVVASPVGANVEIVQDAVTGLLAQDTEAWVSQLYRLLNDPELGRSLGQTGRKRVEKKYCLAATAPRLVDMLRQVSGRG